MKKCEVYEGWRFLCEEGDMFMRVSPFGLEMEGIFDEDVEVIIDFYDDFYGKPCPCGKGCKPIKCKIIVENKI